MLAGHSPPERLAWYESLMDGGTSLERVAEQIAGDTVATGAALPYAARASDEPPAADDDDRGTREESFRDILRVARRDFGRPLLAAKSLGELRRKIEWSIEQPSLATIVHAGAERVTMRAVARAERDNETSADRVTFGASADTINEGFRLWATLAHARQRVIDALNAEATLSGSAPGTGVVADPFQFATSPSVPPPVSRLLLRALRSTPAILALAYARHRAKPLPEWMAQELVEKWVDGQRAALCLIASVPCSDVPLDVVSAAERLDFTRLDHAMRIYRERSRVRFDAARLADYPMPQSRDSQPD